MERERGGSLIDVPRFQGEYRPIRQEAGKESKNRCGNESGFLLIEGIDRQHRWHAAHVCMAVGHAGSELMMSEIGCITVQGSLNIPSRHSGTSPQYASAGRSTKSAEERTILFPQDVALPTSYLNDVRFDLRRGEEGVAYIT